MILFADTSALVKLYVSESGSVRMATLVAEAVVGVSMLTFAETHATFARRLREGLVDRAEHTRLVEQFDREWVGMVRVPTDEAVVSAVPSLCARYPLRGADAVQLASAMRLRQAGLGVTFLCSDARLLDAALGAGFAAVDPAA